MKSAAAISIGLATLALALGYAAGSNWYGALTVVAISVLWLVGARRGWQWMAPLGLVGHVSLAALGIWLGLSALVLLIGAVAALAAWDLDCFAQRLRSVGRVVDEATLIRSHLQRLLAVASLGMLLGGGVLQIRVELSFGWVLGLGMLAIVALSRLIGRVRQETD